eukprot:s1903_g4.t1
MLPSFTKGWPKNTGSLPKDPRNSARSGGNKIGGLLYRKLVAVTNRSELPLLHTSRCILCGHGGEPRTRPNCVSFPQRVDAKRLSGRDAKLDAIGTDTSCPKSHES